MLPTPNRECKIFLLLEKKYGYLQILSMRVWIFFWKVRTIWYIFDYLLYIIIVHTSTIYTKWAPKQPKHVLLCFVLTHFDPTFGTDFKILTHLFTWIQNVVCNKHRGGYDGEFETKTEKSIILFIVLCHFLIFSYHVEITGIVLLLFLLGEVKAVIVYAIHFF